MRASITYSNPNIVRSTLTHTEIAFAGSDSRAVHFDASVARCGFLLRACLRALGAVRWSQDHALPRTRIGGRCDPIFTVHPDRAWLEALSPDGEVYAAVIFEQSVFDLADAARFGTTHVDFPVWLWSALGDVRTNQRTQFRVACAEGGSDDRRQPAIEVADDWVRSFLEIQAAMAAPGTQLAVRAADLMTVIQFLSAHRARVSPRALRYELEPGSFARLVIEPWEYGVTLAGAVHGGTERRVIRTWGRRGLALLAPLLPYAEHVDAYLKDNALPSFYVVSLPGMRFVLGLNGHVADAADGGGFLLTAAPRKLAASEQVLDILAHSFHSSTLQIAQQTSLTASQANRTLTALCAAGRAMYDLEARRWRHRELFLPPIDLEQLYPADPERDLALAMPVRELRIRDVVVEERRVPRHYESPHASPLVDTMGATMGNTTWSGEIAQRHWRIRADCAKHAVEVVLNSDEQLLFGTCDCAFHRQHLLRHGPCAHMLATIAASTERLRS